MGTMGEWIRKQRAAYSRRDVKFMKRRFPQVRSKGLDYVIIIDILYHLAIFISYYLAVLIFYFKA